MKIVIFGGNGMLGHKLVQVLQKQHEIFVTFRKNFAQIEHYDFFTNVNITNNIDVESFEDVKTILSKINPDVVINAVGIIKQLPTSKNLIKTLTINSIFPHRLAEIAQEIGFRLLAVGTDCVFNGDKGNYTESDIPDAVDLYGKSKNLGELSEKNCLTLRTSIIGRELETTHSLVEWFLSNRNGKVKGFTNAVYSGFPTVVFADIIADLIENYPDLQGLYHVSSAPISKFELLKLINEKYGANIEIEPFADFYIDRSLNSDKFRTETGFAPLAWEKMIEIMADDSTPYKKYRK